MKIRYAWHIHHDTLAEVVDETLKERRAHIREYKPTEEQATRLRLLKLVKAPLPEVLTKTRSWTRIRAEERRFFTPTLHKKECPNCPWKPSKRNFMYGTIFPK